MSVTIHVNTGTQEKKVLLTLKLQYQSMPKQNHKDDLSDTSHHKKLEQQITQ